jgi:type I restriction enzyme S subunit
MAFKQVRLGDYFKFEKGLGYKGEFLAEDSEVALIGMDSHNDGGGYKEGSEKPYSGPYKPEHVAEVGDVIFAATEQGFGLLGSPLMVPESEKFQTFIFSHHVLKAFPISEDFLPEYLYNIYRVEKYRNKASYGDTGTTVRAIPSEVMEEQMVPLPDLSTQQAINEIISLIDQQIANNKALSRNLEALAQSLFKSWFIDFDPVHAKKNGEKPFGMDADTAKLFPDSFVKSDLGIIPKGWKVGPVGEVLTLQGGYAFKSSTWTSSGVPVIKIGSVKPGFVDLNEGSFVSLELGSGVSDTYRLPRGSMVIGLSGYVGEVGLVPGVSPAPLLNQRVAKFGLTSGEWKIPFAYCLTRDSRFKLDVINAAVGSAQQNVSNGQILNIERILPPSNLIEAFDSLFHPTFERILILEEEKMTLSKLIDSILPQLVDGSLEISSESIAS